PQLLTPGLYMLMLAMAISITMIGPLMPELVAQYGLRLSEGGLFMTFQSIGGIFAIAIGGMLADRMSKTHLLAGSFLLYAVSLFLVATAPTYYLLLVIFFVLGASTRLVDTVNNALVADLHTQNQDAALSLLHTFFAVGAL